MLRLHSDDDFSCNGNFDVVSVTERKQHESTTYAINFYIEEIIEFGYWIVDLIQSFDIIQPHISPTSH